MVRRTRPLLGWLAVASALAAATVLGLVPALAAEEALSTADRQTAEIIYANQCATCHGSDGGGREIPGSDEVAPPLVGNPDVTVGYADLTIRVGRMPPPDNAPFDNRARHVVISDHERELLVAYLADQFDLEGEVPEVADGSAAAGREVFAANCAQCHGSTGAGGVAGAGAWTPPVIGQDPVAVAEAIRVGPFEMPRFGEEQISDEQIGDISAFLDEVAAEQGTPLGLVELNPVYASGFAFLFAVVILLSTLWIAGRPTMFPDEQPATAADDPSTEAGHES